MVMCVRADLRPRDRHVGARYVSNRIERDKFLSHLCRAVALNLHARLFTSFSMLELVGVAADNSRAIHELLPAVAGTPWAIAN